MNKNTRYITNRLKLREPQAESLELFEKICCELALKKDINLDAEAAKVRSLCPTFKSFERDFPSICFALATGVGKTRLMGAFIAWLYYEKGIKNFFVMAPNLTIYNKLIRDFGDINNPKYVFRGLDAFSTPPRIIHGENYEYYRQQELGTSGITINVFNISKLNAETRSGKEPRMKRLNEVLGESYFNYLVGLPDLVLLMDESHHYRADRGMAVINELKPVLGIEVTATPQVERGGKSIKFENVVYEYSLAHALEDGKFVKVPAVATRKNFDPEQYSDEELDRIKLVDGVRIHIETQAELEKYARENGKKIIKPFVLVVAKDTNHSGKLKDFICSDAFFKGYYKDKVLEIHSNQTGAEKDENIEQLLSLEEPDNKIEIVIHVNMLKEGWDVTNLYTIIPLRRSASETLTEQTIGRGLRLPYGERTGVDAVDRLNIVHHDKYDAIINAANDPNSIIRKLNIIEVDDSTTQDRKTIVELPSRVEETIASYTFVEQIKLAIPDNTVPTDERKSEMAKDYCPECLQDCYGTE
jgi:type III restriction enzyme